MGEHTVPVGDIPRLPVGTLAVDVCEGADAGVHAETESEQLTIGSAPGNVLELNDETVSAFHCELTWGPDGVRVVDLGSTNGTLVGDVRVHDAVVPLGTVLRVGRSVIQVADGEGNLVDLLDGDELGRLRGNAPAMRRLMAQIVRVAQSEVPVLILGESGTGKELVALSLHEQSRRVGKPFVTVDCGALAPQLVASELFGHERGAFTGADRQHIGAFERADGGTLFLDELGELPSELQPQLLGALERRRFRRVGGRNEVKVDVRVVAATNRDLRAEVNAGTFRMDLFYRIAVVSLRIPPLRERPEDVPLLIQHFQGEAGHLGSAEGISKQVVESLQTHHWPGNVRELRNWVEATLAMGEPAELPDFSLAGATSADLDEKLLALPYKDARSAVLDNFERSYLERLLEKSRGNVSRAARQASMDRSYLLKLLKRHGLRVSNSDAP